MVSGRFESLMLFFTTSTQVFSAGFALVVAVGLSSSKQRLSGASSDFYCINKHYIDVPQPIFHCLNNK